MSDPNAIDFLLVLVIQERDTVPNPAHQRVSRAAYLNTTMILHQGSRGLTCRNTIILRTYAVERIKRDGVSELSMSKPLRSRIFGLSL